MIGEGWAIAALLVLATSIIWHEAQAVRRANMIERMVAELAASQTNVETTITATMLKVEQGIHELVFYASLPEQDRPGYKLEMPESLRHKRAQDTTTQFRRTADR